MEAWPQGWVSGRLGREMLESLGVLRHSLKNRAKTQRIPTIPGTRGQPAAQKCWNSYVFSAIPTHIIPQVAA